MVDTILAQGCTLAYSSQPSRPFFVVLTIIHKTALTITIRSRHLHYPDSHISCLHPHQQAAGISIFIEVQFFLIPILVGLLVASSAYSCESDGGIHGGRWRWSLIWELPVESHPASCLGITPVARILIDFKNSHLARVALEGKCVAQMLNLVGGKLSREVWIFWMRPIN